MTGTLTDFGIERDNKNEWAHYGGLLMWGRQA